MSSTEVAVVQPVSLMLQDAPDVALRDKIVNALCAEMTATLANKSEQCNKDIDNVKSAISACEKRLQALRTKQALACSKQAEGELRQLKDFMSNNGYKPAKLKIHVDLSDTENKTMWNIVVSFIVDGSSRYADDWSGFKGVKVVSHTAEYKDELVLLAKLKKDYADLLILKSKLDTELHRMPQHTILISGAIARRDIRADAKSEEQYAQVREQFMKIIPRGVSKLLGE